MMHLGLALAMLTAAVPTAEVRITGPFGKRLDRMVANHVMAIDSMLLSEVFHERTKEPWWQTEFWGKYMHSAVPFWKYIGSDVLKRKIDAGVENVIAAQEECGYIGNYFDADRYGHGWDVWGTKYTLMGLMHYYDGTGDKRSLEAAMKLCDYLIGEMGPGGRRGRPLRFSGSWGGLASGSVLEPVVWLYNRTKEKRYLDFAAYVVSELCDCEDGPQLVKLAKVPVADRRFGKVPEWYKNDPDRQLLKAYEMMSCYQGLVDYAETTGKREFIDAAVQTAEKIVEGEINLAGGAAAGELWFHGADQQYRHRSWQQETCVLTTWMRLCEKLLSVTDNPKWADQLERTFYNAYLGAMRPDGSEFASYSPLMGDRSSGHHHCRMHTDCCNSNGPRGYLAILESFLSAKDDVVTLNFYMSGNAKASVGDGAVAKFQLYTLYPKSDTVELWYRSHEQRTFSLRLRIPSFSENTVVKVNGVPLDGAVKCGYFTLRREWHEADKIELTFCMPVKMHRLHDYVGFTRGPVCLARDTRFADGALDEEIRADRITAADLAAFRLVRPPTSEMFMALSAELPAGYHTENPDSGIYPLSIHFTDYASAGNAWQPDCRYRVWLPELIPGR